MNKQKVLFLLLLTISFLNLNKLHAMPINNGFYTTSDELEWLDVTITRGLSYNEVIAQVNDTSFIADYGSGWRYASGNEFDNLMLDFGFSPLHPSCDRGNLFCDVYPTETGPLINTAIAMLGDTKTDSLKADDPLNPTVDGFGFTYGLLADRYSPDYIWAAVVWDAEITDLIGNELNLNDRIWTHNGVWRPEHKIATVGSYLVRDVAVPETAAFWLFLVGLLGLIKSTVQKRTL